MGTKADKNAKATKKVRPERVAVPARPAQEIGRKVPPFRTIRLRDEFAINREVLARALGVSVDTLAGWEDGKAQPNATEQATIRRVAGILNKLAGSIRKEYIPTWLEKPNAACKEIGTRSPIELLERGDYDSVEDLIFYLGSGVPF